MSSELEWVSATWLVAHWSSCRTVFGGPQEIGFGNLTNALVAEPNFSLLTKNVENNWNALYNGFGNLTNFWVAEPHFFENNWFRQPDELLKLQNPILDFRHEN